MPAPVYGQITTTGSAQQLDAANKAASCNVFLVKAPLSNSTTGVFIGDSSVTNSNGHQLDPGDQIVYERQAFNTGPLYQQRPSDLYVWIVTNGDKVTWIALQ